MPGGQVTLEIVEGFVGNGFRVAFAQVVPVKISLQADGLAKLEEPKGGDMERLGHPLASPASNMGNEPAPL
jgi:hypothetical protein